MNRWGLVMIGIAVLNAMTGPINAEAAKPWWPDSVTQAVSAAGDNRAQLLLALEQTPVSQREGMQFLMENMPDTDRQTLTASFLLQNVNLAYQAWEQAPWKASLPQALFLNDVLPYANLTEARDNSREMMREKALPLIAGRQTPGEAALRLNEKLFSLLNVRYSTERARPDQSPQETIASGKASCSGLAILLVDACRAVGVPARVAGTPLWANGRGNHTWVEVWDSGGWHFIGAAEPDAQGLDHAWFTHDASEAVAGDPLHAIYAASFGKTGLAFPLVWATDDHSVPAVNVTDRYAPQAAQADATKTHLLVKVLGPGGKRVVANVTARETGVSAAAWAGTSAAETADWNNLLAFDVPRGCSLEITARHNGQIAKLTILAGSGAQQVVEMKLSGASARPKNLTPELRSDPSLRRKGEDVGAGSPRPSSPLLTPPSLTGKGAGGLGSFSPVSRKALTTALTAYFHATPEQQAHWTFPASLDALLRKNEPAVRQAAWEAYRAAPAPAAVKADFDAHQVRFGDYLSPYTLKTVGTRPIGGWGLVIAMHGGGGAPKALNDEQWQEMQSHYRDHPENGGYLYLALRAPNDTWNGFYDDYVYPLVANLVRQFLRMGDVDPNKVFLIGYSHGGYGAFAIGPKEPDLFAAIHASAAAPTDGETTAKTLRNTIFSAWVGDHDTMYGRLERDQKFAAEVQALRGDRADIYPVTVEIKVGHGHSDLPDRDFLAQMTGAVRNPVPRELTWLMTDTVITDFFWLHTNAPNKTEEIDALCRDNVITVTTKPNVTSAAVFLDSRLIDFRQPVTLTVNGKTSQRRVAPSLRTLCETLQQRGDPDLAFTARLELPLQP